MKTIDDQGGYTSSWITLMTVWAKIENTVGKEGVFAQRLDTNYDHKITIRNATGITPEMRVIFNSRKFEIKSVSRVEERRWWIEILAREGVAS